jgi:hypothetical protein
MSNNRVVYNGTEMAVEWPARIEAAQDIHEYVIGGKRYARIRYGAEHDGSDFTQACHDCGVLPGQYHVEGVCDMEECPNCQGQVIGCDCPYEGDEVSEIVTAEQKPNPPLKWQELLKRMEPELPGFTVFLETPDGEWRSLASIKNEQVVYLVIACIRDGISSTKTEEPIRDLAERLSTRVGVKALVLLSRRLEPFSGYYLRVE